MMELFGSALKILFFGLVCSADNVPEKNQHMAIVPSISEQVPGVQSEPISDNSLDITFTHGFIASLSVIIVSEIGDKTFFIAAIMSMQHSRTTVFLGAITALVAMTILSVLLGFSIQLIPHAFTYYLSSILFAGFGLKMLYDGYFMGQNEAQEEYEEVQSDLKKREDNLSRPVDVEGGYQKPGSLVFASRIFIQAFTMTFLAEWGDRSQIATILLAARENLWGVALGGFLGHALCTGLAVVGGRLISQRISARSITLLGGVVFVLFAVSALFINPDTETG